MEVNPKILLCLFWKNLNGFVEHSTNFWPCLVIIITLFNDFELTQDLHLLLYQIHTHDHVSRMFIGSVCYVWYLHILPFYFVRQNLPQGISFWFSGKKEKSVNLHFKNRQHWSFWHKILHFTSTCDQWPRPQLEVSFVPI